MSRSESNSEAGAFPLRQFLDTQMDAVMRVKVVASDGNERRVDYVHFADDIHENNGSGNDVHHG